MFIFHICLCPGACLFWIIKQEALSSFLSLRSLHFLSLVLFLFSLLYVSSASFGWNSGSHWDVNGSLWRGILGTSINPGVYLPAKKGQPLFVGCFISIVLQGHVFIRCPHVTGGLFKKSGYIRIVTKARKWHRKQRCHRNWAVLHIPLYLFSSLIPF